MQNRLKVKIDHDHDIPYGAGMNKDSTTIYIDRRVPRYFITKAGKRLDVWKYVEVHELVEKAVEDAFDFPYEYAHHMAQAAEDHCVAEDGFDVKEYEDFWKPLLAQCRKRFTKVPKDLHLKPYIDEGETDILAKLRAMGVK